MKRKWTLAALASAVLATQLTACGGAGSTSEPPAADAAPGAASTTPAAKEGKTQVSVTVLKNEPYLQQAERLFEEAHPHIDIDIRATLATPASQGKMQMTKQSGVPQYNEADLEKYRTSVNAELMSGKAADLIAVEALPFDKYANKNLLADLGQWMGKGTIFTSTDYFTRVFEAGIVNGKSYAVPIQFGMNMTIGNTPLLDEKGIKIDDSSWTWKDLLDKGLQAVQTGGDASVVMSGKPKVDLVTDVVLSNYSQYVNGKKASFDSKDFTVLLEQIRDMYDQGLLLEQMNMSGGDKDVFKSQSLESPMILLSLPQLMYDGKGTVYRSPSDDENGGIAFSAGQMFAINDKSKNKEEAWEFLEFLMSEKIQSIPNMSGFPVHKASLENSMRQTVENIKSGRMKIAMRGPNGQAADLGAVTDQQIKELMATADKVGSYAGGDPNVMKIVKEEAQAFFNKEKTAEAAAKMIQNRVTTYLNE